MCLVVDADVIMANLFVAGKVSITIRDLAEISRKLEATQGGIFVDVSINSVLQAVEQRPDMFIWDGYCVQKTGKVELFNNDYVDDYFNWRYPPDVVEVIRESAVEPATA